MIRRLIKRAAIGDSDGNHDNTSLIEFKFMKSESNESFGMQEYNLKDMSTYVSVLYPIVGAVVDGVEALVDLPFILRLKDFAMESIKPLASTGEEIKPTEAFDIEDAGVFSPPSPAKSESPSDVTTGEPSSESKEKDSEGNIEKGTDNVGKLTFNAKVKKPLIALVEDANTTDSRALVLNVSIADIILYLCTNPHQ